jgi:hypothetical protein
MGHKCYNGIRDQSSFVLQKKKTLSQFLIYRRGRLHGDKNFIFDYSRICVNIRNVRNRVFTIQGHKGNGFVKETESHVDSLYRH